MHDLPRVDRSAAAELTELEVPTIALRALLLRRVLVAVAAKAELGDEAPFIGRIPEGFRDGIR